MRPPKAVTFTLLVSAVWLLTPSLFLSVTTEANKQQPDESSSSASNVSENVLQVGPLKVDLVKSYNISTKPTMVGDKIRLNKYQYEDFYRSNLLSTNLGPTTKWSRTDELVPCKHLDLANPQFESLLECRPLEARDHRLDSTWSEQLVGQPGIDYVMRSSDKMTLINSDWVGREPFEMEIKQYTLENRFASENLRRILKAIDVESLKFNTIEENSRGFYFESDIGGGVQCSGNLFLTLNQTRSQFGAASSFGRKEESSPSWTPKLEKGLARVFEEMIKSGGLVGLHDVLCSTSFFGQPLGLSFDFTLIHQKQFPYLIYSHTMRTYPVNFWHYSGSIKQSKRGDAPGQVYYTAMVISSRSIFKALRCYMTVSASVDGQNGNYFVSSILPQIAVNVSGNWTVNETQSNWIVYHRDTTIGSSSVGGLKAANLEIDFKDDKSDNRVTFTFKLRRDMVVELLSLNEPNEKNQVRSGGTRMTLDEFLGHLEL